MRWIVLLLLPLLAACASGPPLSETLDNQLGRTELEIVRDYGVPDAEFEAEGRRFLRWSRRELVSYPDPYWGAYGPYGPWTAWPGPIGSEVVEYACDIEIEFGKAPDAPEGPWRAAAWRTRGNDCR